jgi:hypothetical protein
MSDTTSNDIPARVAVLEEIARGTKAALERIERRLDSLDAKFDGRFDRIDGKFERIDGKFERIDSRFDTILREQRTDFRFLVTLIIGMGAALLGVMAHGFKWI